MFSGIEGLFEMWTFLWNLCPMHFIYQIRAEDKLKNSSQAEIFGKQTPIIQLMDGSLVALCGRPALYGTAATAGHKVRKMCDLTRVEKGPYCTFKGSYSILPSNSFANRCLFGFLFKGTIWNWS